MNAGKDYAKAVSQAQANADLTRTPRYVHSYNGVWWISKSPLTCEHTQINPS